MKVAMVSSTYPRFAGDGAGKFVQSIAEAVAALGHEVHVLAPYHPLAAPYPSSVQLHHYRYVWPDSAAVMGYAQSLVSDRRLRAGALALIAPYLAAGGWALRKLASQHRFDVLHAHWVIPGGVLALPVARTRHIPLVVSLHGSDVFVALRNPLFGEAARQVFQRAGAVTACSPDLQSGALRLGAAPSMTQVLPYGADLTALADPLNAAALRQRWGIGPDDPIIVTVGRLVAKKGYEYLVRAMPATLRAVPNARFVIVGDGAERQRLEQLAATLGVGDRLTITGMVKWNEVPGFLHFGDIFVLPSIHDDDGNVDGLPNSLLEAMAAGKPVVASRVAGVPMAVEDGHTGFLVTERQPEQLAAALTNLLSQPDLARQMGQAGRRRVEVDFNWGTIAQAFVRMYRQSQDKLSAQTQGS